VKAEERTEKIMDWLEGRLSAEESAAMEKLMEIDADFADEYALLSELIAYLGDLDADFEPSTAFHQGLMARISLEQAETERKPVNQMTEESQGGFVEEVGIQEQGRTVEVKKGGTKRLATRLFSFTRRRPVLFAAACCLLLVVFVSGGNLVSRSGVMGYQYTGNSFSSWSGADGGSMSGGSASSPAMSAPTGSSAMPQTAPSPPRVEMSKSYDMADPYARDSYAVNDVLVSRVGGPEIGATTSGIADAGSSMSRPSEGGESERGGHSPADQAPQEQKIIRTGNINLEVDRLDEAFSTIKSMAAAVGGYITNEHSYIMYVTDGREYRAGSIQVKIPYNRFNELLGQAESLGKVLDSSVWAEDVTAQFIDLQSRIKVFETKHSRLLAILEQSGELETILAVEKELAETEYELDSIKGQLRYLLDRTDFSTLSISVTEKRIESVEIRLTGFEGFARRVGESFNLGTNSMIRSMGNVVVWLAGNIAGFAFLAILLGFAWFLWLKPWWKKRTIVKK